MHALPSIASMAAFRSLLVHNVPFCVCCLLLFFLMCRMAQLGLLELHVEAPLRPLEYSLNWSYSRGSESGTGHPPGRPPKSA